MASYQRHTQRKTAELRHSQSSGKLPVAEPASIKKFMLILLLYVCRKVLLVNTKWRMGIYVSCVTIGSVITDLFPFPNSYFSHKGNFINQYLVKVGWGWTFAVLLVFITVTSYIYTCGDIRRVGRHLSRLCVGTLLWYVCTQSFEYVENVTGLCDSDSAEHWDKSTCRKSGFNWIGFDVSGHTFLLMHCLLTISEEAKCVKDWERIKSIIQSEEDDHTSRLNEKQLSTLKLSYVKYTPIVRILMLVLVVLMFIWELMLLSTTMYFHNMPQKLTACGFASAAWFISYGMWYKIENFSPGLPGQGPFKYIR